ncbi:esterase-like activity of phytase family protein [Desulfurobacterium sp.]
MISLSSCYRKGVETAIKGKGTLLDTTLNTPLTTVKFDNGVEKKFTIGYGSGAYHSSEDPYYIVYTISDRGVNIDCDEDEEIIGEDVCETGKIFPVPDFGPHIFKLKLDFNNNTVTVLKAIPLKDDLGLPVSGISNTERDDTPYDIHGYRLPYDQSGLDTEAIVKTKNGDFWISDEYAPSIVHVSKDGKVIARYVPKGLKLPQARYKVIEALPSILLKRHKNRGIEALAISPDEKYLYFAMQSPLDNPDSKTYKKSRFVRVFKMEIANPENIKEYVYTLDTPDTFLLDHKKKQNKVKVSEMRCLGDDTLLILERVSKTTKLYRVNLKKAKPLPKEFDTDRRPTLEEMGIGVLADYPSDVIKDSILKKELVLDTGKAKGKFGKFPAKIEGLAIIPEKNLFMINDNDFGITGKKTHIKVIHLNNL